jgi:glycosyltransferase involved in cell wall biosynthesis
LPEELPPGPVIVNPRGHRPGSLRQDCFFRSIPLVLAKVPQAVFVCPPLAGDSQAEGWVRRLGIGAQTRLWPRLDRAQMWALLRRADLFVSPSVHDGTPNSLLEAMACGCFPVVGRVESLAEWIRDGVNGFLVDATSPAALADGMIAALEDPGLRAAAAKQNARIVAERAEHGRCMAMAQAFYCELLGRDPLAGAGRSPREV